MSSLPTVSIITPSLNQGEVIGDCLESVRAAAAVAGTPVEHLVVDGGSTDQTLEVLGSQSHARWISGKDNGQTDAINKGLRQTSGEVIGGMPREAAPPRSARVRRNAPLNPTNTPWAGTLTPWWSALRWEP